MKKSLIIFLIVFFTSISIFAQNENTQNKNSEERETTTLLSFNKGFSFSGYGAPTFGLTVINGIPCFISGGRGGVIINSKDYGIVFGGAGYSLCYPTNREDLTGASYSGDFTDVLINYGGLLFEYHYKPQNLFHFSIGSTFGKGEIGFLNDDLNSNESDSFFMIEPEIAGYVNIATFFRLGAAVAYRIPFGIEIKDFNDSDFRNIEGRLLFEFGWF